MTFIRKHKRAAAIVSGLAVIIAATAAYAAVASAEGSGRTRASACQVAKDNAATQANRDQRSPSTRVTITRYGACDCSSHDEDNNYNTWTCTVDAYYTTSED